MRWTRRDDRLGLATATATLMTCLLVSPGGALAEDDDKSGYTEAGTVEAGGSVGLSWDEDLLTIGLRPSIGVFVADRWELSSFLDLEYEREEGADGTTTASVVLEPSYHLPIAGDDLFLFAGMGVGVGHDGDDVVFEGIPRIGLNIPTRGSTIVNVAGRVPVFVTVGGDTTVGIAIDLGLTTTF